MVMGLMHIATSPQPNNPIDPLAANYYTRQAVALGTTPDEERFKFLVGQLEKGTPLSNFEPEARQFVIDFNNNLIAQQEAIIAADFENQAAGGGVSDM